jgi:glutathione-independent formaldehyde dehydrogenase
MGNTGVCLNGNPDRPGSAYGYVDMLRDIFPTGFHGACTAKVRPDDSVYVAGAGPVGLAAAYSAMLLGAAVVIVGDMIPERLEQAGRPWRCRPSPQPIEQGAAKKFLLDPHGDIEV